MNLEFEEGDYVRIDIPDKTDPDYDEYHDQYGIIQKILEDDADELTHDPRDVYLFRVEFEDGSTNDFRWRDIRPAQNPDS